MLQELAREALMIFKDNNYSNEMALAYSKTALYIKLNNVHAKGHFIFYSDGCPFFLPILRGRKFTWLPGIYVRWLDSFGRLF